MRSDVPSPDDLKGGRFWATAVFTHPTAGEVRLPVGGGNRLWQADQVPGARLSGVLVPRYMDGADLLAEGLVGSDGHRVELIQHTDEHSWSLGTYLVERAPADGPKLTVDAVELRQCIIDHEARAPRGVFPGSTIRMILDEICREDRVPLYVDRELREQVLPAGFALGTDRGEAVEELLTAWGAVMAPYLDGMVVKAAPREPVTSPPPIRFTEGAGGTLVEAVLELDRGTVWNHFRVRQHDSEFVAEAVIRTGKYSVDTYGWRSKPIIESDAIAGRAQAQAVAVTEAAKAHLRAVTVPVEAVADARVEGWDAVEVMAPGASGWGRVTGLDVPLLHDDAAVYHVGLEV